MTDFSVLVQVGPAIIHRLIARSFCSHTYIAIDQPHCQSGKWNGNLRSVFITYGSVENHNASAY